MGAARAVGFGDEEAGGSGRAVPCADLVLMTAESHSCAAFWALPSLACPTSTRTPVRACEWCVDIVAAAWRVGAARGSAAHLQQPHQPLLTNVKLMEHDERLDRATDASH